MTHSGPDDIEAVAARLARAEELVTELQHDNTALREELDVARGDVETLQNALSDVTPLHRHVAGAVKGRLGRTDARMRNRLAPTQRVHAADVDAPPSADTAALLDAARDADQATARSFADQPTTSRPLSVYLRASRACYGWARRVLAALKRRLR